MDGSILGVAITVFAAICIFGWATRSVRDPQEPLRWARAFGVTLTIDNRALVTYYSRLVAVLRVIGGLGGLLLGPLFDQAFGTETTAGGGAWVWVILGWMIGSWRADRSVSTALRPGSGASLTARHLRDYLPRSLRWSPAFGAATAVALAGVSTVIDSVPPADRVGLWAPAGMAVVVAVATGIAQSRVVGRPQPVDRPDLVGADDGIRANTLHHLGGGAAAATGFLLADVLWAIGLGAGGSAVTLLALGVTLYALIAWRFSAFRAWQVRREVDMVAAGVDPVLAPTSGLGS